MRVRRLAASEWGNSTHHPSSRGGLERGRRVVCVCDGEGVGGGVLWKEDTSLIT